MWKSVVYTHRCRLIVFPFRKVHFVCPFSAAEFRILLSDFSLSACILFRKDYDFPRSHYYWREKVSSVWPSPAEIAPSQFSTVHHNFDVYCRLTVDWDYDKQRSPPEEHFNESLIWGFREKISTTTKYASQQQKNILSASIGFKQFLLLIKLIFYLYFFTD